MKKQVGAFELDLSAAYQEDEPQPWRKVYAVHPCADVFPMMSEAELDALAKDIKANGQQQPITFCRVDGVRYLLDGRNRLEAMERAGLRQQIRSEIANIPDPAHYVIGANIHRRHLTKAQQAELIVKAVAAMKVDCAPIAAAVFGPSNDRAKLARSFNPTAGKKGGSTKDPVLVKAISEGAKLGIGKRTIQNARAKLGIVRPPKSKPQAIAPWKAEVKDIITKARRSASAGAIRTFILALLKDTQ